MKLLRFIPLTFLGFLALTVSPQIYERDVAEEWVRRYDYQNAPDYGSSIAVDDSGNVYVTGTSSINPVGPEYATIKYNSGGIQQWVQRFPGGGREGGRSIAIDDSSNVYVTGVTSASGGGIGTIKYNSMGTLMWVQVYRKFVSPNDTFYAAMIKVDKLHNVYITGTRNYPGTFRDYLTIKYSATGMEQWVARYNGPVSAEDMASALVVDDSGNVYVTGESRGSGPQQRDIATVKYDSSGVQRWAQRYPGAGNYSLNRGNAIGLDNAGGVYVVGGGTVTGLYRIVTIKYSSLGIQQWVSAYGNGEGRSIGIDNAGNIYVSGYSGNGTNSDFATIKYSSSGVQQWVTIYNGSMNLDDEPWSLAIDSSQNIYVTGGTNISNISGSDYATIKYDSSGLTQWLVTYNGPGNRYDAAHSIAVDKKGNVYVTGSSEGNGTQFDYATIKYSQPLGIERSTSQIRQFQLYQNFPNPFNGSTRIDYLLPWFSFVKLSVYDLCGRTVGNLINENKQEGKHTVEFESNNLPTGVYFYRLEIGQYSQTKKMLLIK